MRYKMKKKETFSNTHVQMIPVLTRHIILRLHCNAKLAVLYYIIKRIEVI